MKSLSVKALIAVFFVVFSFSNLLAQAPVEAQTENSILWEISGNGLETPSYLFGTIHLIPKKEYFFTKNMEEKFNSCKSLVIEADINMPLKEQIKVAQKMMLPKNKSLETYMTEEQFAEYNNYLLDSLKIKKSIYKRTLVIQPIFSSAIIINELLDKPTAYEKELNKMAKKQKMEYGFLETLDYQLDIISQIPVEEQINMLFEDEGGLNPLDSYDELLSAYKKGDLGKLLELSMADASFKKFEKELLIDRNKNWIPKIEEMAKKQASFFAVGAAHLPGEYGVIKLLKEAGYTVKAVEM